jgi:hypothetical protein
LKPDATRTRRTAAAARDELDRCPFDDVDATAIAVATAAITSTPTAATADPERLMRSR